VTVRPGETVHVTVKVDRRLLADFDETAHGWRIDAGQYRIALGSSAIDLKLRGEAELRAAQLKP
jgi:beta-glucosidase